MKNKKISKKALRIMLTALLLTSVFAVCEVYARYALRVDSDVKHAQSEEFYFESNFEDGGLYLFPSDRDFPLLVKNYDYFEKFSASDVSYTVSLDSEKIHESVLSGGESDEEYVTIEKSRLAVGNTYKVTLSSKTPFVKNIEFSIFVVDDTVESYYTLTDEGNRVKLDLYIGTTAPKTLNIAYGTELSPDNTNSLMRGWTSADGTATLTDDDLHCYSHYTLIFFGDEEITEINEKTPLYNGMTIDF